MKELESKCRVAKEKLGYLESVEHTTKVVHDYKSMYMFSVL